MADEKKLTNEEITDEQANEASGGSGSKAYTCGGGCGKSYWGTVPFYFNGKPCCANCYAKLQQQQGRPERR